MGLDNRTLGPHPAHIYLIFSQNKLFMFPKCTLQDPLLLKFMSQSAERDGRFVPAAELLQTHPQARFECRNLIRGRFEGCADVGINDIWMLNLG